MSSSLERLSYFAFHNRTTGYDYSFLHVRRMRSADQRGCYYGTRMSNEDYLLGNPSKTFFLALREKQGVSHSFFTLILLRFIPPTNTACASPNPT